MATPLPAEPVAEPVEVWCPGGGQPPAGESGHTLRFVYGGGCATCKRPVTVDDNWMTRPHHTLEYLRGER